MNIVITVAVSLYVFLSITAAFLIGYYLGTCKPRRNKTVHFEDVIRRAVAEELK